MSATPSCAGPIRLSHLAVVPPDTGIVHQVNLEHLAAWCSPLPIPSAPTSCRPIPTRWWVRLAHHHDQRLGRPGLGVGGIEAEAPCWATHSTADSPGARRPADGLAARRATATDLVLTVTEILRKLGVVGKFVEFFGPGIAKLPLADRATIANMAPEFGATCAMFPIDEETLAYLRFSGRAGESIALVEAYCREQGLFATADAPEASTPRSSSSTWPASSPAWPGRAGRRNACPCPRSRSRLKPPCLR